MSDKLERLLARTPAGPWDWFGGYPQRVTNAGAVLVAEVFDDPDSPAETVRLIALAPDLARLLVDAMAVLATACDDWACKDPECPCSAGRIAALLARFAVLEQRAGEGQA